jgi:hypothetical protein
MTQIAQNQPEAWLVVATWALVVITLGLALLTWRGMARQQRAMIRPVLRFRSDYEKIPPQVGCKINFVNVGPGVALNVRACYQIGDGAVSGCEYTESVDRGPGQHHTPGDTWVGPLGNAGKKLVWLLYEDSQGLTYCTLYRRDSEDARPTTRVWAKPCWDRIELATSSCPKPPCPVCRRGRWWYCPARQRPTRDRPVTATPRHAMAGGRLPSTNLALNPDRRTNHPCRRLSSPFRRLSTNSRLP